MDTNKITLCPYITFNNVCEEAMNFYQGIFGGKLEFNRFGDYPGDLTDEQKNKIMHASLMEGAIEFMASDCPPGKDVTYGDNINMALSGWDEAKLTDFFTKLATGGQVTVPLEKQMWGDLFGACTDKYGTNWMVNIGQNKPADK